MTFSKRITAGSTCLAVALLLSSACARATNTSISTVMSDPGRFDGKTIQIRGEVVESMGVLGYGTYRITDGKETLTVVTKDSGAPRKGAEVRVQGTFRAVATVGNRSISVLEEEKRAD